MQRACFCPTGCGTYSLEAQVAGKMIGGAVSAAIGGTKTKSPWGALIWAAIGAGVGHVLDLIIEQQVQHACPRCGVLLRPVSWA